MQDFNSQLKKSLRISAILLALLCLALIMRPGDPLVWGLLIGVATGMASAFFLGNRANRAVEVDVDQGKVQIMAGAVFRLLFIILILFLVFRTGWINLIATAIGIFTVHGIFIFVTLGSRGVGGEASVNDNTKE